jgi:uncharacterized membrane protein (DUF441 family)
LHSHFAQRTQCSVASGLFQGKKCKKFCFFAIICPFLLTFIFMTIQFNSIALLLVVLILLGVLSNNSSITISATVLLLMQQTFLAKYLPFLEKNGLTVGVIILTIGVLAPIVSGKVPLPTLSALLNWKMFVAIAVGVLVAWLASRGVPVMRNQAILLTGLMIGTVLGVAFFGGIPVGPLIAAGILSLFIGKA